MTSGVGEHTISHNMDALVNKASFGMGNRMSLLLYPIAAFLRNKPNACILIVGPRTEDDIYWARSLGISNVRGLDLFSYSPWVDIGDIHETSYADNEFDAVILGWVISYSSQPALLVEECKRITKVGGYLAFGIESNPDQRRSGNYSPPRVNALNSSKDIAKLVGQPIAFIHDPQVSEPTDNAVVFQINHSE